MVHFKTRQIEELMKVTIAVADKIAIPAHLAYYSARYRSSRFEEAWDRLP